jgi:hypothetical protein
MKKNRAKWLEQLREAIMDDGVDYLAPIAQCFGQIAACPSLMNLHADRDLDMIEVAWSDHASFAHVTTGTPAIPSTLARIVVGSGVGAGFASYTVLQIVPDGWLTIPVYRNEASSLQHDCDCSAATAIWQLRPGPCGSAPVGSCYPTTCHWRLRNSLGGLHHNQRAT